MKCVVACVALFALGTFVAGDVQALEIQVAPRVLVMSSAGEWLTIHTDLYEFEYPDASFVLTITPDGGSPNGVEIYSVFLDDCFRYVVRCTRSDASEAVGDFEGKSTTATVTLTVKCCDLGFEDEGSEEITVRH